MAMKELVNQVFLYGKKIIGPHQEGIIINRGAMVTNLPDRLNTKDIGGPDSLNSPAPQGHFSVGML